MILWSSCIIPGMISPVFPLAKADPNPANGKLNCDHLGRDGSFCGSVMVKHEKFYEKFYEGHPSLALW